MFRYVTISCWRACWVVLDLAAALWTEGTHHDCSCARSYDVASLPVPQLDCAFAAPPDGIHIMMLRPASPCTQPPCPTFYLRSEAKRKAHSTKLRQASQAQPTPPVAMAAAS